MWLVGVHGHVEWCMMVHSVRFLLNTGSRPLALETGPTEDACRPSLYTFVHVFVFFNEGLTISSVY